jgi:tubulin polyglutamylase TTLL9
MNKNTVVAPPVKKKKHFYFRSSLFNTIYDVLKDVRNYKQTEDENEWDFFWADVHWIKEQMDHVHLEDHQRVNHFRNHFELTRKDLLVKNIKRAKRQLEKEDKKEESKKYDFIPSSYILPSEYSMFAEEFKKNNNSIWIMKPNARAQGKGVFLVNKLSQTSYWKKDQRWKSDSHQECYVVQKYIENPYLIGGKKFDLRIYVLVISYSPLIVYLYREGFARFTFQRFSMNLKDIDNNYIHLTNNAVQKTCSQYDKKHCKWDIRRLRIYLNSKHGQKQVDFLFSDIQDLILRALFSVQKIMIQDKHCFEMYGYDILIDENLKPWLLGFKILFFFFFF